MRCQVSVRYKRNSVCNQLVSLRRKLQPDAYFPSRLVRAWPVFYNPCGLVLNCFRSSLYDVWRPPVPISVSKFNDATKRRTHTRDRRRLT